MMRAASRLTLVFMMAAALTALGCRRNTPPVARPTAPPPPPTSTSTTRPPAPPTPVAEPTFVPPEPIPDERISSSTSLDQLNKNSPLQPVYFEYDSSEISPAGRTVLDENAAILRKNSTWMVTIEGHCDERGTAEYNLALGERRAVAARTYLLSLGIPATRLRTVSYGKEFPFDPGRDERAFSQNRRAHFVITAQ
jgi:peptidoglycan-associated lipoprotein